MPIATSLKPEYRLVKSSGWTECASSSAGTNLALYSVVGIRQTCFSFCLMSLHLLMSFFAAPEATDEERDCPAFLRHTYGYTPSDLAAKPRDMAQAQLQVKQVSVRPEALNILHCLLVLGSAISVLIELSLLWDRFCCDALHLLVG